MIAQVNYILRSSLAKLYAAKFKLRTRKAVFTLARNDLSKPIGKRAKSIIGVVDEGNAKLQGIKFTKITKFPIQRVKDQQGGLET